MIPTGTRRRPRVVIRMNVEEMGAVERLAAREYLVPSALIRRLVLRECELAGIQARQRELTEFVGGPADNPGLPEA